MKRRSALVCMFGTATLGLTLAGCANHVTPQALAGANAPLAPGMARVVVMRPNSVAEALTFVPTLHLYVDGRSVGELASRSFLVTDVKPGSHFLRLYGAPRSSLVFPMTAHTNAVAKAGETLYFECTPFYDHHSNTTTVFFRPLTQAQGRAELAQLMQSGT